MVKKKIDLLKLKKKSFNLVKAKKKLIFLD